MMKQIFAVLKEQGSERSESWVFNNIREYHEATFSPDVEVLCARVLEVKGRTYDERKEYLRDLAIEIQHADDGGLSWMEVSMLEEFFRANGQRYGLLREFHENGIC